MDLTMMGWRSYLSSLGSPVNIGTGSLGRVAVENKTGYSLFTEEGEILGQLAGKFHMSKNPEIDFPKVGDWVRVYKLPGEKKARIEEVLARKNSVQRKEAGKAPRRQILASNVDLMFLVMGLPNDFNLSRLERYLLISSESGCVPVVVINKSDAVQDPGSYATQVKSLFPQIDVLLVSAKNGLGLDKLMARLPVGSTSVFLGSSGVGKSSLVNFLLKSSIQKVSGLREDLKGRHTTTRREMFVVPGGGVIIDTPGMRELGMVAQKQAVEEAYSDLQDMEKLCQYNDCDHKKSEGCALVMAVKQGELSSQRYENFLKLRGEADGFASRADVVRQRKNKFKAKKKDYLKMVKNKFIFKK